MDAFKGKEKNWISKLFNANYTIHDAYEKGLDSVFEAILEARNRDNPDPITDIDELKEYFFYYLKANNNEKYDELQRYMFSLDSKAFYGFQNEVNNNTLPVNNTILKYLEDALEIKFIILSEDKYMNTKSGGNPFECVKNPDAQGLYPFIILNKKVNSTTKDIFYDLVEYKNPVVDPDPVPDIGVNMLAAYMQFCQGAGLSKNQIDNFITKLRGFETKSPEEQARIRASYKQAFDQKKLDTRKEKQEQMKAYRAITKHTGRKMFEGESTILGEAKGLAQSFLPSASNARQNVIEGLKKLKTMRSRGKYFPPEFVEDVLKGKQLDFMKIREAAKKGDKLSKQIASRTSCPLERQYNDPNFKDFKAKDLKELETEYKTCCRTKTQKASNYCTQIKKLANPKTEADMDDAKAYFKLEDKESREKYVSILADYYNDKCTGLTRVFRPKKCEKSLNELTRIETGKGIEGDVETILAGVKTHLQMVRDYIRIDKNQQSEIDVFNGNSNYSNSTKTIYTDFPKYFDDKILPQFQVFMDQTNQTQVNADEEYTACTSSHGVVAAPAPTVVAVMSSAPRAQGNSGVEGFYTKNDDVLRERSAELVAAALAASGATKKTLDKLAAFAANPAINPKMKDVEESELGRKIEDLVDLGLRTAAQKNNLLSEIVRLREEIPSIEKDGRSKINSNGVTGQGNTNNFIQGLSSLAQNKIVQSLIALGLTYLAYNYAPSSSQNLTKTAPVIGGQRRKKRKTRNRKGRRTKRRGNSRHVTRRRSRR